MPLTLADLNASLAGGELLNELRDAMSTYLVLPSPEAADAITLWIAASHAQAAWISAPRLLINSPEKRCGKSRLLDILELTVHKPFMALDPSPAALYRSIGEIDPPTLLIDEADAIWSNKRVNKDSAETLRAILNAGFGRGRPVLRCVGNNQIPVEFPTFCMAAIAGIADFAPDTVRDRAITVTMRRRAEGESVSDFREKRDRPYFEEMRERLHDWVDSVQEELSAAEPVMPVLDREADTWEPLIAIADAAGGEWPERGRRACLALTSEARESETEQSNSVRLLQDIRDVFTELDALMLSSSQLSVALRLVPDAPWEKWDLQPTSLAAKLRPFRIRPDRIRDEHGNQVRGYRVAHFEDAWGRYLSAESRGGTSQAVTPSSPLLSGVTDPFDVTAAPVTPLHPVTGVTCADDEVTACDGPHAAVTCRSCGTRLHEMEVEANGDACFDCAPDESITSEQVAGPARVDM